MQTDQPDGLVDALVQACFKTMAVLNRVGAENDLSLTQMRVFGILRDRRLRMAVLADYLGLEKSTMSGLVDRAERRGLLQRAPSATDGRATDVFLTAEGHAQLDRLYGVVVRELSPMTDRLTASERERLRGLLERLG